MCDVLSELFFQERTMPYTQMDLVVDGENNNVLAMLENTIE